MKYIIRHIFGTIVTVLYDVFENRKGISGIVPDGTISPVKFFNLIRFCCFHSTFVV